MIDDHVRHLGYAVDDARARLARDVARRGIRTYNPVPPIDRNRHGIHGAVDESTFDAVVGALFLLATIVLVFMFLYALAD